MSTDMQRLVAEICAKNDSTETEETMRRGLAMADTAAGYYKQTFGYNVYKVGFIIIPSAQQLEGSMILMQMISLVCWRYNVLQWTL